MEQLDQSKEVRAALGMEFLNVYGTTEAVHLLLTAARALETSTANIEMERVSVLLLRYAELLNAVELQAKYSGKTLKEYTGCDYDEV